MNDTQLKQWVDQLVMLARKPAQRHSGSIKYWRNEPIIIRGGKLLTLDQCFYTSAKATALQKNYRVQESIDAALKLWDKKGSKPFANVAITTHAHEIKAHYHETSNKHASAAGPCINAITLIRELDDSVTVQVSMRTSETIRKLPADIWFVHHLLEPFKLDKPMLVFMPSVTQLFANQWGLIIHHQHDPVAILQDIKCDDPKFHRDLIKALNYDLFVPTSDKNFIPTKRPGEWLHEHLPKATLGELKYYVKRMV